MPVSQPDETSGASRQPDRITCAAQSLVRRFLGTLQEFPPRMKPARFSIDQVLEKMEQALQSN